MKDRIVLLLLFVAGILSFSSCDKYHAKKLSGTYQCSVHYHSFTITPSEVDSTYSESIEVKREGKELKVLGYTVPIDSVWETDGYMIGSYNNYFQIRFVGDSLYCYQYSGGLGGNVTYDYQGVKLN